MKLLIFSLFFLALLRGFDLQSVSTIELGDPNSCCSLEWVDSSDESAIQSAISVYSYPGKRFYFAHLFGKQTFVEVGRRSELLTKVLANPNNCALRWINESSILRDRKVHLYMPTFNTMVFAQTVQTSYSDYSDFAYNRSPSTYEIAEFYDIFQLNIKSTLSHDSCSQSPLCKLTNRTLLYVDCKESMKRILGPQLFSIEFDEASVLKNSLTEEIASVNVFNENNYSVTHWTIWDEKLPIRLAFRLNEYKIAFIEYMKNKVDFGLFEERNSNSSLQKIYTNILPNMDFFKSYWISGGVFSKNFWFSSKLQHETQTEIPPGSNCKISLVAKTFGGTVPVAVKFAIVPDSRFEKHWTTKQIVSSLQAINVDTSQMVEENGKLIVTFTGKMEVNSFVEDKIEHKCSDSFKIDFRNKTSEF